MDMELKQVYQGVLAGDLDMVTTWVQAALDKQVSAEVILKQGMMAAMAEVGQLFEEGEYFVPELLIAARAMQGGLEILKPFLVEEDVEPIGKVVTGTVKGDLHDIGKNLVGMMMGGVGFEVVDIGTNVPPEKFIEAVKESGAQVVAMSAMLTTTMAGMSDTVKAFEEAGLRDEVKIMVGGAPVTESYASKIGADGYAPDASQAAKIALSYIT
ncbi:MAG: corrinoid protein [Anaerolineaceae bacterium]|nr:corrinoid protein [Anaerolineaceae bacterium]